MLGRHGVGKITTQKKYVKRTSNVLYCMYIFYIYNVFRVFIYRSMNILYHIFIDNIIE